MVDVDYCYYDWDGEPITLLRWYELWVEDRHLALTHIGDIEISTVWLGIDHNFRDEGPPLLFESMVFGGDRLDGMQARYPNRYAALAGHDRLVAEVKEVVGEPGTPD